MRMMRSGILAGLGVVLALGLGAGQAEASMKYECWTYVGGKPGKMTHVVAGSNAAAVRLAEEKFRNLGAKGAVRCK